MPSLEFAKSFARETWCLYAVGLVGVGLRCTARIRRLTIRRLQVDDYVILFATVWYTVLCVALNRVAWGGGSNLMTPAEIAALTPETKAERIRGSKWVFVSEHAMVLTLWSLKSCMLMIYSRLTSRLGEQKFVKLCALYIALGFVGTELTLFLICRPLDQYWAVPTHIYQCSSYQYYEAIQGSFSISSDVLILLIAVLLVKHAHLPTKQKIILTIVFGMGVFIIIAATLTKVYCLVPNLISYVYMNWYFREATIAMLVTSLPLTWSLIREIFPVVDAWTGRSSSNENDTRYIKSRIRRVSGTMSGYLESHKDIRMKDFCQMANQNRVGIHVSEVEHNEDNLEISDDDHSSRALRIGRDISFKNEYDGEVERGSARESARESATESAT